MLQFETDHQLSMGHIGFLYLLINQYINELLSTQFLDDCDKLHGRPQRYVNFVLLDIYEKVIVWYESGFRLPDIRFLLMLSESIRCLVKCAIIHT